MTIAQQFNEQLTQVLASSSIGLIAQLELEKQAAILVLSAVVYKPIAVETRLGLMGDAVSIILDFSPQRRMMILTSHLDAKYYAVAPPTDTLINTYINRKPVDFAGVNHAAAPDLIKQFLEQLL
jgi:hypothetical protein